VKLISFTCHCSSFVSPQNSNNNSLKREREVDYEEAYEYSDEEEFEAKRLKEV
jgi:hypothetical protein